MFGIWDGETERTSEKRNIPFWRHYAPSHCTLGIEMETHTHLLAASYIFITTFVHATITLRCLLAVASFLSSLTYNVKQQLCRMGEKCF